jgi:hypothetical protein
VPVGFGRDKVGVRIAIQTIDHRLKKLTRRFTPPRRRVRRTGSFPQPVSIITDIRSDLRWTAAGFGRIQPRPESPLWRNS